MPYQIDFAEAVKSHLDVLTAGQRSTVLEAIERQLTNDPSKETGNRKPLRPNPVAPWELRVGSFRVFYEVKTEDPNTVRILAVGEKQGNRLLIGGQDVEL